MKLVDKKYLTIYTATIQLIINHQNKSIMSTVLIVVFATLLAFFCVMCILAPKFVTRFAHTEEEVLDGVVVATYRGQSVVRLTTGKLCCMKDALPLDTKVVVSVVKAKKPNNPLMYVAIEGGNLNAEVICRLSDEVLLCRRCGRNIFVACTDADQAELSQVKERVCYTYKSLGKTYHETEDYLSIPVVSTSFHFDFPVCVKQA